MNRRTLASLASLALIITPLLARAHDDHAGWYAGDFHVHTVYSHDSWDPVNDDEESEPYTLGHSVASQFSIASSRGLDFLAITDHNDIRSQDDPGFGSSGVLGIPAYENSLGGHAQMLGATSCYSPAGPFAGVQDCNGWPDKSAVRITQMADHLRDDGGAFQINHPAGGSVDFPHDRDWGFDLEVVPDSIEVWNIQSIWQAPLFSSNSLDDAIRYWESFLNAGHRVAATGGSDNHWVSTTAVQGVGQPTTWVFAEDRTVEAIVEGVRAGRTTISWQPPGMNGPRLDITEDGALTPTYLGRTVAPGTEVWVTFQVEAGANLPYFVQVITNEGVQHESFSSGGGFSFVVPEGTEWLRAELLVPDHTGGPFVPQLATGPAAACDELIGGTSTYCRNRLVRLAMTSAVYVD